jgi:hypothetical protein
LQKIKLNQMARISLPAGTDVAEMAFFDIDSLPTLLPRGIEEFAPLISQNRLIRFPTVGDGGYLLQVFVNDEIPTEIRRYCQEEDILTGNFQTPRGRVAFGGMESVYAEFKKNPKIRSDGVIEPGNYSYTAYRTEFPDELVTQATRVEQNAGERWLDRAPILTTLSALAIAFGFAVMRNFITAVIAILAGYFAVKWLLSRPGYQILEERRKQAQLAFPSIVIELRSIH